MSSRTRVLELSKKLDKAKDKQDANKVINIMQTLDSIQINISLLSESGLGKKVNAIRKSQLFKHQSLVIETATALIAKWKKSVTAEKKAAKRLKKAKQSNAANGNVSNTMTKSLSPELATTNELSNDKQQSVDTEDTDNGFQREAFDWKTGDERRDKMILKFIAVLKPKPDKSEYICFTKIASQIEASLGEEYGVNSKEYGMKYRDLHFNMKRNNDLCMELLMGQLTTSQLVKMTSEEMASSKLKEEREKERKWKLDEARNDGALDVSQTMTDEFKCGKCKQRKTKYSQAQTRGADEPMTTFVTCLVCGNRWRF